MRAPDALLRPGGGVSRRPRADAGARVPAGRRCATRSRAASGSGRSSASRRPRRPGATSEAALPAAAALELVHAFSLVHDDLPALDDDDERRGRPSAHVAFGEGVALLAGDALLAEAFRLALSYPTPEPARELAAGDARDDRRPVPRHHRRRRRSRRSCTASRPGGCSPRPSVSGSGRRTCPRRDQAPWRAFGEELGLLFQIVDDVLDGDGYAARLGVDAAARARRRGGGAGARPAGRDRRRTRRCCEHVVDGLAVRTA